MAPQDDQGGKYGDLISKLIFLTGREVGENLAVMREEGGGLRWNQAGKFLINDSEDRVLIKYIVQEYAQGAQR